MNGGVSRHDLAIYFAVALPSCAVVFFVARLPPVDFGTAVGKLSNYLRGIIEGVKRKATL
jgi:hypothetical protein